MIDNKSRQVNTFSPTVVMSSSQAAEVTVDILADGSDRQHLSLRKFMLCETYREGVAERSKRFINAREHLWNTYCKCNIL